MKINTSTIGIKHFMNHPLSFRHKYLGYGRLLHSQITHHCLIICNDPTVSRSRQRSNRSKI